MYKGINLKLHNWEKNEYYNKCFSLGKQSYSSNNSKIEKKIESFSNPNGSLNASSMIANWFPEIEADIFISHSHKDLEVAIAFAGLLLDKFGLKAFIDSCVWDYADNLIQLIDDEYCWNKDRETYSYKKRNYSTSHAYMMLSNALIKMIDLTECLFFLNTPNSIKPNNVIDKTLSPWIYSEIAITKLIRQKSPQDHRPLRKARLYLEKSMNYSFPAVEYDIDLDHLNVMDIDLLNKWIKLKKGNSTHSLDLLYTIIN